LSVTVKEATHIFALKQRNAIGNLATTVYRATKKWSKQITTN